MHGSGTHQTELANTLGRLRGGLCDNHAIKPSSSCDAGASTVCQRQDSPFPGKLCGFVVGPRRCGSCCRCLCCCFGWARSVLREQLSKISAVDHRSSLAAVIRHLIRPPRDGGRGKKKSKKKKNQTLCSQNSEIWRAASASKLPSSWVLFARLLSLANSQQASRRQGSRVSDAEQRRSVAAAQLRLPK